MKIKRQDALQKRERSDVERVQERPTIAPSVDIYENANELLLVADLPGVDKDHLKIHLEKEELIIEGGREESCEGNLLGCEYRSVDYQRSFYMPTGIDTSKIEADLKQGTLYLHLPKSPEIKPRTIPVKGE